MYYPIHNHFIAAWIKKRASWCGTADRRSSSRWTSGVRFYGRDAALVGYPDVAEPRMRPRDPVHGR